jgi:hypothetical protein
MQAAAVNFDAQDFFQSYIAKMDLAAEVLEKGKLARFGRRFKQEQIESEVPGKTIGKGGIEVSVNIEEPDSASALAGLNNQLQGAGIEPPRTLRQELLNRFLVESPGMFLSQFELNLQAPLGRQLHNLAGLAIHVREAFTALDARDPEIRAKVEVGRELMLCHGDLEGASACHCRDVMLTGGGNFPSRRLLVGNHPAGHRNLQDRKQVRALRQMTFNCDRVISRIKRACPGRQFFDSNPSEIFRRVKLARREKVLSFVHELELLVLTRQSDG